MKEKGIIIAAILFGAWLGNRLRLPSGYLTGGMIAGLLAKGFFSSASLPAGGALSVVSQLLVAYVLVSNSDLEVIKKNPAVVPIALGYIVVLTLFCFGLAIVLNKVFHLDIRTAIFATAPGGLSGMALSMTDGGAETPISMTFHLFRIILVLILTPLLASFFAP